MLDIKNHEWLPDDTIYWKTDLFSVSVFDILQKENDEYDESAEGVFRDNNEIEREGANDNDYWLVFANRQLIIKDSTQHG